ncbi:choice-of-anchor tandem repeat GloVer-containing protein, partial [Candidatus Auribacterota bacterium]
GNDLIYVGDRLYGMTNDGGSSSYGVVFRIGTDAIGYTVLFNFSMDDGVGPKGKLHLDGGMLYGMTIGGGASSNGVIFSLTTEEFDYVESAGTNLSLGFSESDIGQLSDLYFQGKEGLSPDPVSAAGINWSYIDGALPGQSGKSIGDSWEIDGKYYIYLGSGLEGGGEVPEPSTLLLLLPFIGLYWLRRRRRREEDCHREFVVGERGDLNN